MTLWFCDLAAQLISAWGVGEGGAESNCIDRLRTHRGVDRGRRYQPIAVGIFAIHRRKLHNVGPNDVRLCPRHRRVRTANVSLTPCELDFRCSHDTIVSGSP